MHKGAAFILNCSFSPIKNQNVLFLFSVAFKKAGHVEADYVAIAFEDVLVHTTYLSKILVQNSSDRGVYNGLGTHHQTTQDAPAPPSMT